MPMSEEQYQKVSDYLLQNGQQELNGHLDGLWQELNDLRKKLPSEEGRVSAQDFQDQASEEPTESPTDESTASESSSETDK